MRRIIKSLRPPLRLSMPALETLAVIAYKQPVTSPEISEIRGVNTSGVISTLLDKHLITTAGRKEVMGRPILYKTSKEFLMRFGLSDLEELPSLRRWHGRRWGATRDLRRRRMVRRMKRVSGNQRERIRRARKWKRGKNCWRKRQRIMKECRRLRVGILGRQQQRGNRKEI